MVVRVKPRMSPRTKLSGLIRQRKHNTFLRLRVRNVDISTVSIKSPPKWLKYCTCIHLTVNKKTKNKALSRAMGDCSRLLIHSSSLSVRGSVPPLHGRIVHCLLLNMQTLRFIQLLYVVKWLQSPLRTPKINPRGYSPRRGKPCSPSETLLCCSGTRRRSSVLGKPEKTETLVRS